MSYPRIAAVYLNREEEAKLIAAAQAGDTDARNRVIMSQLPYIQNTARQWTWDKNFAEDLVHDCIMQLMRVFHTFDLSLGLRFRAWANRVTWTCMREKVFDGNRVKKYLLSPELIIDDSDEVCDIEVQECREAVQQWIRCCSDQRVKRIAELRLSGMSLREIGREMKLSRTWALHLYQEASNEIKKIAGLD